MVTSVFVILAMLVLEIFLIKVYENRHDATEWTKYFLMGVLLSCLCLFIPCYIADSSSEGKLTFRSLVLPVFYSLKALGGGQELNDLETFLKLKDIPHLTFESDNYRYIYLGLNYIYLIAGPLLTSSFLISNIGDWLDRIRYHIRLRKSYHIFSELNETSLRIAKNIWKKKTVVFCDTKSADKALVSKARECGAVLLYASYDMLKMPWDPFNNKKMQFYMIHSNEDQNLAGTECLIKLYRDKGAGISINAFAESGTGIQVLESMDKGDMAVRFIDMTALLCNHLLLQYPLYDLEKGNKTISVMIVGCDKTGMRMLKTVSWCGILNGYDLKIRVYDKDAKKIEDKFRIQCPEKMENCVISFVEVDAETAAFETAVMDPVKGSPDATYIVMAMGEDEKNLAVADRLFRLFRYCSNFGWTPQILVRVRSGIKSGVYLDRDNKYLQDRKIRLFGSVDDVYGENTLFYSYLERLAFAVDLCYNEQLSEEKANRIRDKELLKDYLSEEDIRQVRSNFLQNEYNRRSSMATALHIAGKLHSWGIPIKGEQYLTNEVAQLFREKIGTDEQMLPLYVNEHIRWNNFTRSEGFQTVGIDKLKQFYSSGNKRSRDDLSKRHLCLVDWDQLPELKAGFNKYVESFWTEYNKDKPESEKIEILDMLKDFQKSDKDIVRSIPVIIELANQLKETGLDEEFYL